jgi:hypothetical protein
MNRQDEQKAFRGCLLQAFVLLFGLPLLFSCIGALFFGTWAVLDPKGFKEGQRQVREEQRESEERAREKAAANRKLVRAKSFSAGAFFVGGLISARVVRIISPEHRPVLEKSHAPNFASFAFNHAALRQIARSAGQTLPAA